MEPDRKSNKKRWIIGGVGAALVLGVIGSFLPDQRQVALINSSGDRRSVRTGGQQVELAPRSVEVISLEPGDRVLEITGGSGFSRSGRLSVAKATNGPVIWYDVDGASRYALINADLLYETTVLGAKLGPAGHGKLIQKVYEGDRGFEVDLLSSSAKLVGPFEPLPESVSRNTRVVKLVAIPASAREEAEVVKAVLQALGEP